MAKIDNKQQEVHQALVSKSNEIARSVLPFLGKNRIAATPENYMVFYSYFEGELDEVCRIVDEQINSGADWDQDVTKKVFNRIFSSEANVALLKKNQQLTEQFLRSAKNVVQQTNATAKLADRTADNLEISLQNANKLNSLEDVTSWLQDSMGEMKKFNELSKRLGVNLREEGARLDKLVEAFEDMESMAFTDELTRLNNRRSWDRRLRGEFDRYKRVGRPCCAFILDIDDFKRVNDSFGHDIGDKALQAVAKIMQNGLRSYDFAARYGGEEFCGLLPDTELNLARAVAERLRRRLESTRFTVKGKELMITATFGVSSFRQDDHEGADCLRRADLAMYLAKSKGKNRVYSDREVEAAGASLIDGQNLQ